MHYLPRLRSSQSIHEWVVGEAKVGEEAKKGKISMAVGLALRTGKNTSVQDEGANQAVEVVSLGVAKQVEYSVISGSASTDPWYEQ